MNWKTIPMFVVALALIAGPWQLAQADDKDLKDKIAAVEKDLAPFRKKAATDPEVKAAKEALAAAQAKYAEALDAATAKVDPKAKELIDKKKELQDQLAAKKKEAKPKAK